LKKLSTKQTKTKMRPPSHLFEELKFGKRRAILSYEKIDKVGCWFWHIDKTIFVKNCKKLSF